MHTNRKYVVNTVQDLVSTNIRDGEIVEVLGWSGVSDGGGGEFLYDASSSATVDNGLVFDGVGGTQAIPGGSTSTGTGRFLRIRRNEPIQAKWFGVYGNGTSDDSAALAKAVEAAAGSALYLSPGDYLSNTITLNDDNTTLYGNGTLVAQQAAAQIIIQASGVKVQDLKLAGANTARHGVLVLDNSTHCELSNLYIKDISSNTGTNNGIYFGDGCHNLLVSNCVIEGVITGGNYTTYGIHGAGDGAPATPIRSVRLVNNVIKNITCTTHAHGHGINIENWTADCDIIISNNSLYNCGVYGIYVGSPGVLVTNNKANLPVTTDSSPDAGIYIAASDVVCEGNFFEMPDGANNALVYIASGAYSRIKFVGNNFVVDSDHSKYLMSGIRSHTSGNNVVVVGNSFGEKLRDGILLNIDSEQWIVAGNSFRGCSRWVWKLTENTRNFSTVGNSIYNCPGSSGILTDYTNYMPVNLAGGSLRFANDFPPAGTFNKGDISFNQQYSDNGSDALGWICSRAGTMGTLSDTANTTDGSADITVGDGTNYRVGDHITIANAIQNGIVTEIDGNSLTLHTEVSGTVTGGAVSYFSAEFGNIYSKIVVDTVADLVELANVNDGDSVYVLGWHTVGDGGGGEFYYDEDSTTTVNCGTVFDGVDGTAATPGGSTSTGTGRFIRVAQTEVFKPEWFGAKGDGSTNNKDAIQKTLDVIEANGGGSVLFGQGKNYRIESELSIGPKTEVVGYGATITQFDNNKTILEFGGSTYTRRISIRGISLTYTTQSTSSDTSAIGIKLASGTFPFVYIPFSINIQDVRIDKACYGIALPSAIQYGGTVINLSNIHTYNCASYGIYLAANIDTSYLTYNVSLKNIYIEQNPSDRQADSAGIYVEYCNALTIDNCFVYAIEKAPLFLVRCRGTITSFMTQDCKIQGGIDLESCFGFVESSMTANNLIANQNTVMISGTADAALLSTSGNCNLEVDHLWDIDTDVERDDSSGQYYAAYATSTDLIKVHDYNSSGDTPAVVLYNQGIKKPIRVWDGNVLTEEKFGNYHVEHSGVPDSETWSVGDIVWTNENKDGHVMGWVCTSAGTPGTWQSFGQTHGQYARGNISGATLIDWQASRQQFATLTGDVTLSFDAPDSAGDLRLVLAQDATGGHGVTWPTLSGNDPSILSSSNDINVIYLYFDGTNYHTFTIDVGGNLTTNVSTSGCVQGNGSAESPLNILLSPTGNIECRADGLAVDINIEGGGSGSSSSSSIRAGGFNDILDYETIGSSPVGLQFDYNNLFGDVSLQSADPPSGIIVSDTGIWVRIPNGDWIIDYGLNVSGDCATDLGNMHATLQLWNGAGWDDVDNSDLFITTPYAKYTASASRNVFCRISESYNQYRIAASVLDIDGACLEAHVVGGFFIVHEVN